MDLKYKDACPDPRMLRVDRWISQQTANLNAMGPTLTSSWTRRGAVLATWCAFVTGSALKRDVGAPQTTSAFVDLGYSQYQGTTLGNGINQYLGLRFAAPPVGDLRWRAPAEPQPTNGTQSAAEACSSKKKWLRRQMDGGIKRRTD